MLPYITVMIVLLFFSKRSRSPKALGKILTKVNVNLNHYNFSLTSQIVGLILLSNTCYNNITTNVVKDENYGET